MNLSKNIKIDEQLIVAFICTCYIILSKEINKYYLEND